VQISLYVILFHLYFGILYLLGRMLTINCFIYKKIPWFVEHSHNEYFIEFVFFLPKYDIFHLSKLHDR
jgi:hypothetical protein